MEAQHIDRLSLAIQNAPANALRQAARQADQALFVPVYPSSAERARLRANYTGQVWSLLEAAKWADSPISIANCEADPDQDGERECILTSESVYAQFEIEDGSLSFLFVLQPAEASGLAPQIHQIIAPSSQFIVGLSESQRWDLNAGRNADPDVISGAFIGPRAGYLVEVEANVVTFYLPGEMGRKTYRLSESGLEADLQLEALSGLRPFSIPLALDPWLRFAPGWPDRYHAVPGVRSWVWQVDGGPSVYIRANAPLTGADFTRSRALFAQPEDPNQDFPAGHYLPFPLALIEITPQAQLQIVIEARFAP